MKEIRDFQRQPISLPFCRPLPAKKIRVFGVFEGRGGGAGKREGGGLLGFVCRSRTQKHRSGLAVGCIPSKSEARHIADVSLIRPLVLDQPKGNGH